MFAIRNKEEDYMKLDYIFSGILILVLGIIINSSVNTDSPFDVHQMCGQFSFLQPCGEKIHLLDILSLIIIGFGVLVLIYGLAVPPHKVEKRVEEVIIKERRERESDTKNRIEMIRCPKCGGLNPPDAKYCKWCGYQLTPGPEAQNRNSGGKNSEELGQT